MWSEVLTLALRVFFLFFGIYQLVINSQIYKDFVGEPATSHTFSPLGTVLEKEVTKLKGDKNKVSVNGSEGDSPLSVTIVSKSNHVASNKHTALSYLSNVVDEKTSSGFKLYYGEDDSGIDFFVLSQSDAYPRKVFSQYSSGYSITEVLSKFSPALMQKSPTEE